MASRGSSSGLSSEPSPDFRAIFDAVPLPCLILDPDFCIIAVNEAYLEATLTDRGIVGRNFLEVFPDNPDDPLNTGNSNLRASLERARRDLVTDAMPVQKYDVPRPDGTGFEEKFWSPTNQPVLAADGSLAFIVHSARDVTAAIQAGSAELTDPRTSDDGMRLADMGDVHGWIVEQTRAAAAASRELKEANAELSRRADELAEANARATKASAAKSEFLSRMSHELRTPLTAILGFAQLLGMDDLREDQRTSVDHIAKAGRHLVALVNDILDLERVEAGRLPLSLKPVLLDTVAAAVVELAEPIAQNSGVTVAATSSGTAIWALTDERRLTQILLNLVGNAIKYTPSGGSAVLTVAGDDRTARISVRDDGPGMRPEDLPRAFEPFERLEADGTRIEGAGLGLALARGLAQAMGGTVEGMSEPGHGSTFTVALPRVEPPASGGDVDGLLAGEGGSELPDRGHVSGGHILSVDDTPDNLALIRLISRRKAAWRIETATTLEEARLCLGRGLPDLLLLDLHLPDGNGLELLTELRSGDAGRRLPVIVLTADAMKETRTAVMEAGADLLLTKPFDVEELMQSVDLLLRTGRPGPLQETLPSGVPNVVERTGIYVIEGHDISFYPSAEEAAASVEAYDAGVYDYVGTDGSLWRATVEGPAWGPVTLHPTSETGPDLVAQLRAAGYHVNSSD